MSQEALAVDAGIDRTYVGRLERRLENPTVGVVERLAGAMGLDIVDLVRQPEPDETPPVPLRSGRKSR